MVSKASLPAGRLCLWHPKKGKAEALERKAWLIPQPVRGLEGGTRLESGRQMGVMQSALLSSHRETGFSRGSKRRGALLTERIQKQAREL